MPDKNKPIKGVSLPAIKIIKQIKEGAIAPENLSKEMCQNVVECLLMQLIPISKIAYFLKVSDRTIMRYKHEIEQRNSVSPLGQPIKVKAIQNKKGSKKRNRKSK